jgi:pimeloyl-ACP methyl ester carboxylesterase
MTEFTCSDGTELFYECVGDGPTVMVCAGGPNATFDYLVNDLRPLEHKSRLVYHDYRGSGRSSTASEATYTFEQFADDVAALAGHLGVDSFDVVAHSMGGMVALSCALRHPEHVRRLVLIDTSPSGVMTRMAVPTFRALGPWRALKMLSRAVTYLTWWSWRSESDRRTLARFSIMGTMQEGDPRFRAAVKARETLSNNANASHLDRYAATFDVVDRLAAIAQPALIIYGSRDAPFVAGSLLLLREMPNVRELALNGVGHHPLVEAQDRVVAAIADFLGRL